MNAHLMTQFSIYSWIVREIFPLVLGLSMSLDFHVLHWCKTWLGIGYCCGCNGVSYDIYVLIFVSCIYKPCGVVEGEE